MQYNSHPSYQVGYKNNWQEKESHELNNEFEPYKFGELLAKEEPNQLYDEFSINLTSIPELCNSTFQFGLGPKDGEQLHGQNFEKRCSSHQDIYFLPNQETFP